MLLLRFVERARCLVLLADCLVEVVLRLVNSLHDHICLINCMHVAKENVAHLDRFLVCLLSLLHVSCSVVEIFLVDACILGVVLFQLADLRVRATAAAARAEAGEMERHGGWRGGGWMEGKCEGGAGDS